MLKHHRDFDVIKNSTESCQSLINLGSFRSHVRKLESGAPFLERQDRFQHVVVRHVEIGKMLVDKEPKVCPWLCLSVSEVLFSRLHVYVYVTWAVNGPEILTKYVGGNQKHHTQPKF